MGFDFEDRNMIAEICAQTCPLTYRGVDCSAPCDRLYGHVDGHGHEKHTWENNALGATKSYD